MDEEETRDILVRLQGHERIQRIVCNSDYLRWKVELLNDAANEIANLRAQCDRLARRNTMLVNELEERGRKFNPDYLKNAIVKALYEGEG